MALTIGVDVGGTTVAAGVVDEHGRVLATARRDTPSDDPKKTETVIADVVRELTGAHHVDAVGVGAAGFVDAAMMGARGISAMSRCALGSRNAADSRW